MRLVRLRYLDNYRDQLERWERGRVTDIVCALDKLGRTPLGKAGNHAFRVIRSIERMIDNLAYPGGPDLVHEQVRASTYNYIFAAPYDRRFAALTPEELCYRLREAGCRKWICRHSPTNRSSAGGPLPFIDLHLLAGVKAMPFGPYAPVRYPSGPTALSRYRPIPHAGRMRCWTKDITA